MPNRLAHETSPYLVQHAENPVDWYPWGAEAFERARREDRPILLSIGYSACHWCHVMERESFEDPETARLMNEHFVNVKVDREERPDVDAVYMAALQASTGQGGWPMTVFLTPQGAPFFSGTYFPPDDRPGLPSFRRVLLAVAGAYRHRRAEIEQSAGHLVDFLQHAALATSAPGEPGLEVLDQAASGLFDQLDPVNGGFGAAPKFPQPMALEFLLRHWRRSSDERARQAVAFALRTMAAGGIYDQLGGGFHRYAVDAHWLVPHFEKMLYDNALLAHAYLAAYQATGDPSFRTVVEETLDYVRREMTSPEGGFYSTQDADSEGEEGKFYLWTLAQMHAVLDEQQARIAGLAFGLAGPLPQPLPDAGRGDEPLPQPLPYQGRGDEPLPQPLPDTGRGDEPLPRPLPYQGRGDEPLPRPYQGRGDAPLAGSSPPFPGREGGGGVRSGPSSPLRRARTPEEVARELGLPEQEVAAVLQQARRRLWEARERRVRPGRDEKVLCAWNGLMLASFAEAARVLRRDDYRATAERNAAFLLDHLVREGVVLRSYKDGVAKLNGYLEDYANLADGLLALYETTFDLRWFRAATRVAEAMLAEFWDERDGGFFDTGRRHEALIVRPKEVTDSAAPAGNSVAADVLLRLAVLGGKEAYRQRAAQVFRQAHAALARYPLSFGRLLCALDFYLAAPKEVALVGDPAAADTRALLETVYGRYLPNKVVALKRPHDREAEQLIPLLAGREMLDRRATAYVCQHATCQLPVAEPAELVQQLGAG